MDKFTFYLGVLILMLTLNVSISNAQTLEGGVDSVLIALEKGATNFSDVRGALTEIKAKAQMEFAKEEAAIEAERARLDRIQATLDKDREREAQMLYDEWVERAKANTKLMQAREDLHERELALKMKKTIFKDQLKQAEQKLLSTLGNHLKAQLDYHNSRMQLLKEQLQEVESMKLDEFEEIDNN